MCFEAILCRIFAQMYNVMDLQVLSFSYIWIMYVLLCNI